MCTACAREWSRECLCDCVYDGGVAGAVCVAVCVAVRGSACVHVVCDRVIVIVWPCDRARACVRA